MSNQFVNIHGICKLSGRSRTCINAWLARHGGLIAATEKEMLDSGFMAIKTFKYYNRDSVIHWLESMNTRKGV